MSSSPSPAHKGFSEEENTENVKIKLEQTEPSAEQAGGSGSARSLRTHTQG